MEISPIQNLSLKALPPPPGIKAENLSLEQDLIGKTGYLIDHKAVTMMYLRNLNTELQYLKTITIPYKDALFIPQEKMPEFISLGAHIRQRYPEFEISQITYIKIDS